MQSSLPPDLANKQQLEISQTICESYPFAGQRALAGGAVEIFSRNRDACGCLSCTVYIACQCRLASLDTASSHHFAGMDWGEKFLLRPESTGDCSVLRFYGWSGQAQVVMECSHVLVKGWRRGQLGQSANLWLQLLNRSGHSVLSTHTVHTYKALSHCVSETHRHTQSRHFHTTFLRPASVPCHFHCPAASQFLAIPPPGHCTDSRLTQPQSS